MLRLSLEAHAMFAHASEARVPSMRFDDGHRTGTWAELTRRASQASHHAGLTALAADFRDWMTRALDVLGPHLPVDPELRATARRCTIWQGRHMAIVGDETGARTARDALTFLDTLDTLDTGTRP